MFEHEIEVAKEFALKAGSVVLSHRKGALKVERKENGEVVTAADREVDALIRQGLAAAFPSDCILSEETPDSPARLSKRRVWIVDPIDGTSNFVEGGDEFSISIGLAVDGRAILGVVSNPSKNQLFAGCEECGVTLNGIPVRTSIASDLAKSRLAVSRKEWRRGLERLSPALPIMPVASVAYKLAQVSAGLIEGMFSARPRKEWDICAGVALVLAAGGRVTLLDGREIIFNRPEVRQPRGIIASGPELYSSLREALRLLLPEETGNV